MGTAGGKGPEVRPKHNSQASSPHCVVASSIDLDELHATLLADDQQLAVPAGKAPHPHPPPGPVDPLTPRATDDGNKDDAAHH